MNKALAILAIGVLAATASGCMLALLPGVQKYLSTDDTVTKDAQWQKAYAACLKRSNNDESRCQKEKDKMLEQEEWNEMENSG